MMLSRVDLPDPDGPAERRTPLDAVPADVAQGAHFDLADVIGLGQVAKVDQSGRIIRVRLHGRTGCTRRAQLGSVRNLGNVTNFRGLLHATRE